MEIWILIAFGLITALLAGRKGYNPALWFCAAGIIGLIVLAFLPFVNKKSPLPGPVLAQRKKSGNLIGGVLSAVAIVLLLINFDKP